MVLRVKALLLVMAVCFSSMAFAQSLDEVIEHSNPENRAIVKPLTAPNQVKAVIDSFTRVLPISPMGMPAIERLLDFIKVVLRQIVVGISEIDMSQYKPGATSTPNVASGSATGNEEDGNAATEAGDTATAVATDNGATTGSAGAATASSSAQTTSTGVDIQITDGGAGSLFMKKTEGMTPAQREQAILAEILAGNIPSFLKNFKEVEVSQKLKDGKMHSIRYKVMPDYLAIGSDADFVRMPMSPLAAQVIAEKFGCILPTTKMVDDIYRNAQSKLLPQPMSGGKYPNWQARMTRNEFYVEHQRLVESQCQKSGHRNGMLVAGHKKDVVISNHLNSHQKNVVIYGWHDARNAGKPIQGYGWSHENTYADYSHGIRLISTSVMVDGVPMNIKDVLADKVLCDLLSKEGPVKNTSARR